MTESVLVFEAELRGAGAFGVHFIINATDKIDWAVHSVKRLTRYHTEQCDVPEAAKQFCVCASGAKFLK